MQPPPKLSGLTKCKSPHIRGHRGIARVDDREFFGASLAGSSLVFTRRANPPVTTLPMTKHAGDRPARQGTELARATVFEPAAREIARKRIDLHAALVRSDAHLLEKEAGIFGGEVAAERLPLGQRLAA